MTALNGVNVYKITPPLRHKLRHNLYMATIRKRGTSWRAEVYVHGARESKTFKTKQAASLWALERDAQLKGLRPSDATLLDVMDKYATDVSPTHKGARWEILRINAFKRFKFIKKPIQMIDVDDLIGFRNQRLTTVSPATVAREMTLLHSIFEYARLELRCIRANPLKDVKRPSSPPPRRRRISQHEVDQVTLALGLDEMLAETATQRTALAFLFSIETAMRSSEVLGLKWSDLTEKTAKLPMTKNGDAREVPLSPTARDIIAILPRDADTVFNVRSGTRDALFRRAVKATGIEDLHFHDSRAEAIWRLSKKLDVMELARVIGHRDINSLLMYYNASASELADKL